MGILLPRHGIHFEPERDIIAEHNTARARRSYNECQKVNPKAVERAVKVHASNLLTIKEIKRN